MIARLALNPKTGAKVMVPARRIVKFKIGRLMKQKMQEPAGRVHIYMFVPARP